MDAERMERERFLLALVRRQAVARGRKAGGAPPRIDARERGDPGLPEIERRAVEADLGRLTALGARIIAAGDPEMPPWLRAIPDCPAALFVRGDPAVLSEPQIAIVGSRRATRAGARIAHRLAGELASHGLVVTSGLAQGIDAEAHRGALEAGGRTVAVLGSSLDHVYPVAHRGLADRIAGQGALVSELPFGTPPRPWSFPWRNRIISGLSLGVLVVEAAERSGSLITARLGADQGREVFAVPGSILNPLAAGCHRLLRDGAKLVERVEDVLEELPAAVRAALEASAPAKQANGGAGSGPGDGRGATPALGPDEAAVLDCLEFEPSGADALAARAGLTPEQVYSILLVLELGGFVRSDPAGRYQRVCRARPPLTNRTIEWP